MHLKKEYIRKAKAIIACAIIATLSASFVPCESYAGTNNNLDIVLTPNASGSGSMKISWNDYNYADKCFKVYRRATGASSWSVVPIDYTLITSVRCLQIYPCSSAEAQLRNWVVNTGYGKGIISVNTVYIEDFNNNPNGYLKDASGNWRYEVIFFGTWDCNDGHDLSAGARDAVRTFINQGRGAIFGHDTIVNNWFSYPNFRSLAGYVGCSIWDNATLDASNKVTIIRDGLFNKYPNYIGGVGTVLTIPTSHSIGQKVSTGMSWLQFQSKGSYQTANPSVTAPSFLTTYNNCAMIQTGHSNGAATADEQKILSNVIFYCNQLLFNQHEMIDTEATDKAAPNTPSVTQPAANNIANNSRTFTVSAADNGSSYDYYARAYGKNNTAESAYISQSSVRTYAVTTGTKGFYYIFDDAATTTVTKTNSLYTAASSNSATISGTSAYGKKYLHVAAVDGAGNLGATKHIAINYKLVYNMNISSGSPALKTVDNQIYNATGNFIASDTSGMTVGTDNTYRRGYKFTGWYDDAACTTKHNFSATLLVADKTIYAGWTQLLGSIKISKTSADSAKSDTNSTDYKLSGAKYTVTRTSPDSCLNTTDAAQSVTRNVVTGSDGTVTLTNLPQGTYTITETEASSGYVRAVPFTVVISPDNYSTTRPAGTQEPVQYGYITVQKVTGNAGWTDNNDRYAFDNAVYTIYRNGIEVDSMTTDSTGFAKSSALPLGSYEIRETQSSKGYNLDTENHQITIEEIPADRLLLNANYDPTIYPFTSVEPPKYGYINVRKHSNVTWTTGNDCYSVEGVTYDMQGPVPVSNHSYTTNATGDTEFIQVPLGDYYITETSTAEGYQPDTTTYHVDIATHDQYETVTPKCIPLIEEYPMNIVKYDADDWSKDKSGEAQAGTELNGAYYQVTYYGGYYDDAETATSSNKKMWSKFFSTQLDENGFARIVPVTKDFYSDSTTKMGWGLGTYIVEEVIPPNGYYLDAEDPYVFQVNKDPNDAYDAMNNIIVGLSQQNDNARMTAENALVSTDHLQRADIKVIKIGAKYTTNDKIATSIEPLFGVSFQIINSNDYPVYSMQYGEWKNTGEVVATITTNAQGEATTKTLAIAANEENALALGTYTIHEIPDAANTLGYKESEDTVVSVSSGENEYVFDVENKQGTALRVNKIAKDTNLPIKATASFSILDENENIMTLGGKTVFIADNTGKVLIPEKLMAGNYFVQEVKAPRGYTLSSELVPFEIKSSDVDTFANPVDVYFSDEPAKVKAIIHNVDSASGDLITSSSCKMEVRAAEDIKTADGTIRYASGTIVGTYDTNGGIIETDELYIGRYTVRELTTPTDYLQNSGVYSMALTQTDDGSAGCLTRVPNSKKLAGIQLFLTDSETGNNIKVSATYKIVNAETIVDAEGNVTYEPGTFVQFITTNDNGFAMTSSSLPVGAYLLYEQVAPDGYVSSSEPVIADFAYADGDSTGSLVVRDTNDPQKGGIAVAKVDADTSITITKSPATFEIYAAENIKTNDGTTRYNAGDLVTTITTEEDGKAYAADLYIGKYYVMEKTAPDGYLLDNTTRQQVTVAYQGGESGTAIGGAMEVDFMDAPIYGSIEVSKVDADTNKKVTSPMTVEVKADGDILAPDGSTLYADGSTVVTMTTENGSATTQLLPLGNYSIVETIAPDGYALSNETYNVSLKTDGTATENVSESVIVKDMQQKGNFKITKICSDTNNVIRAAGTEFTIKAAEKICHLDGTIAYDKDTVVEIVKTAADGVAISKSLPLGKYSISETQAPAGYTAMKDAVTVSLGNTSSTDAIVTKDIEVSNAIAKNTTNVCINDKNTNKVIKEKDAELIVKAKEDIITSDGQKIYSAGDIIQTVVTDNDGYATINLPAGSYQLSLVTAPNGYIINDDVIDFAVENDSNGQPKDIEVSSSTAPQKGHIEVIKTDYDTGNAITHDSAQFALYATKDIVGKDGTIHYAKGTKVCSLLTDNTGHAITDDALPIGVYTLSETKAPEGYDVSRDRIEVAITYAGQTENLATTVIVPFADYLKQTQVDPEPDPEPEPEPIDPPANKNENTNENANTNDNTTTPGWGNVNTNTNVNVNTNKNTNKNNNAVKPPVNENKNENVIPPVTNTNTNTNKPTKPSTNQNANTSQSPSTPEDPSVPTVNPGNPVTATKPSISVSETGGYVIENGDNVNSAQAAYDALPSHDYANVEKQEEKVAKQNGIITGTGDPLVIGIGTICIATLISICAIGIRKRRR